ncbi:cytosolic sulfotransferase 5-like [Jatropha curcas]|uniref:cytosolic sulfotransferase 5-like n=1 Tax=Jatropha curcas TaxID=180498 RepID=UPI001895332E|nr:cytosolic sulfotransferase 5-like [Jatropha curcas]
MVCIDTDSPDFSSFTSPRLFSTHLPLLSLPKSVEDLGCKIIYLCRNTKDTFISFYHFTNRLRPKDKGENSLEDAFDKKGENSLEDAFDKFCRGLSFYGPFWDHVLGCMCAYKKVLIVIVQLADLTGELMRLAICRISDGEPEFAEKIRGFVREIYRQLCWDSN